MFSQTAEYALRAAVWLADNADTPVTTQQIANATQVAPDYLAKVMQALARAGLVHAQRGKHGGFTLARPAASVTILEIVNAVEPIRRIRACPLGLKAHSERLCPLHKRLDDALLTVEETFRNTTLADVLEPVGSVKPLCEAVAVAHA